MFRVVPRALRLLFKEAARVTLGRLENALDSGNSDFILQHWVDFMALPSRVLRRGRRRGGAAGRRQAKRDGHAFLAELRADGPGAYALWEQEGVPRRGRTTGLNRAG